jgi:serine/threonine protein kinase
MYPLGPLSQVCGTGPYMPPEYVNRGEVSARTDAFAFGIMAIELLTGLHPAMARELVDNNLFEELPLKIQEHHDGKPHELAVVRGSKPARKCKWPAAPLKQMSVVAAKCVRPQPRHRTTIADVLPELESISRR